MKRVWQYPEGFERFDTVTTIRADAWLSQGGGETFFPPFGPGPETAGDGDVGDEKSDSP